MNNINVSNSSISFNGLIVKGNVSAKNVKKLGDFASHIENINFINDLEKDYGVDAVLDSDITKMSFSHKKYSNLSGKYGCASYPLENVFRDIIDVMKNVKSAINKAARDYDKQMTEKEAIQRGC